MRQLFILVLLALSALGARATHLQNVHSGYCMASTMTQVGCAASSTQDVIFDPRSGGKYRLKIGSQCLEASSAAVDADVSLATCSTAAGQLWTAYKASIGSATRQFQSDLSTAGLPLCLGVQGNGLQTSGTAIAVVECINPSVEWSMDLEYARTQSTTATTVPVFAITSGALGARVSGVTVAAGTALSCNAFRSGGYCALASDTSRAALGHSFAGRTVAGIAPATVSTRGASDVPTPLSMAMRTDMTDVTGPIVMTDNQVLENKRIRCPAGGGACILANGISNPTIRNNEIGPSTPAVIDPSGDDNHNGLNDRPIYVNGATGVTTITGNVIHDGSWGMYVQSAEAVVIEKNFVFNVLGPRWGGNAIQVLSITSNTDQSSISCNKYHGRYTVGQVRVPKPQTENTGTSDGAIEDKINIAGPIIASPDKPLKIWNNRIIGPFYGGNSAAGLQLGDYDGTGDVGWIDVRGNRIARTNGHGIAISGGHDYIVDGNFVDNAGEDTTTNTGPAFTYRNYYNRTCTNITLTNNKGRGLVWYFTGTGAAAGLEIGGGTPACSNVTNTGNDFANVAQMTGTALFYDPISACGE